jgi:hypothetical protein
MCTVRPPWPKQAAKDAGREIKGPEAVGAKPVPGFTLSNADPDHVDT